MYLIKEAGKLDKTVGVQEITAFEFCRNYCTYPTCAIRGNGIARSELMKTEIKDCIISQINLSK